MTLSLRWDHIHLRSAEPDTAAAFYETVFGAVRRARTENGSQLRVTVEVAGMLLFIDRAEPGAAPALDPPVHGIDHLALTVEDLDDALRHLALQGVEILSGPTDVRSGLRIAFVSAPDRVRIELLERREAA